MSEVNINIDYEEVFLKCYHHLLNDNEKYLSQFFDIDFLYGGRDSGKSRHVAMQLILDCMTQRYFKCLLIRKVLNTVRGSQYDLIKTIIDDWDLKSLFKCNESRMEIIFIPTGNGFYGRGLDDVGRIKSFNNPSHCWIEEGNQIEANDFVVILTSLRADQRVKTYFTFNPECEVTYTEFWLYQDYFSHTTNLSWAWVKEVEVDYGVYLKFPSRVRVKDGKFYIDLHIRATHTTYNDNPYCSPERIALYESYKNSKNNAYWYQTYTLGLWGYRRTGGEFWKCFDETKHTTTLSYRPAPLHIVADNNVNPYIAVQIWQMDMVNKYLDQIDELPCESPNNTAAKAARQLIKWMERVNYKDVLFVHGDATANKRSTEDDEGRSFFDKFIGELTSAGYKVHKRVGKSNPSVSMSGDFVNEIYESNYEGWTIRINVKCRKSIEDYTMAKEDADGGILKKNVTDKETKQSYQKYGHFSDDKRYFVATVLPGEFAKYQTRSKKYYAV